MPWIDEVLDSRLTPAQKAAAIDQHPEILTLACAGSGKSTTMAFRIAHLVAKGASPKGITAFTFTEKAAESIKRSVAKALTACGIEPTVLGAMYIGTIHAYCQQVLGATDARFRQFDVLDGNRLALYLMSRYGELNLPQLRNDRNTGYFDVIRKVCDAWSIMNDEMVELTDVADRDPVLGDVLRRLRGGLERDQFIDFSLMIRLVVESLQQGDDAALGAVAQLRHLLVDEYQDVNTSQEQLVESLHAGSETLFVVGDDDQAIYGWRGADVNNILTFSARYPNASSHTLSTNFRSTRAIVESADTLIQSQLGPQRIEKNPDTVELDEPRSLHKLWFETRDEEAEWVAERIAALIGTAYRERDGTVRGLTAGDFAILMRSTRSKEGNGSPRHEAFTAALQDRGVDVSLEAGGSPFDLPEVEALRETFELLRSGTPTRTQLESHFRTHIEPNFPDPDFDATAAVLARWGRELHTPPGGARRRVFPQNLVHELLDVFGVSNAPMPDAVMSALGVFSQMIQDVETVYVSIDSPQRFGALLNFLQNAADNGYDLSSDDVVRTPDAVTVSTVHKMKGLEFPAVFVVDVEQNRFPAQQSSYKGWLPANVIADALARGCYSSNHNEEARLIYTALTRAERYVAVTGSKRLPSAKRMRKPSMYMGSINHDELTEEPGVMPSGLQPEVPQARIGENSLPTSYSEIRYFLKCPKDYQFRFRFGFSPAIVEMFGYGQTVHAAIGKLHEEFADRAPSGKEAEGVAEKVFHLKHIPRSSDPVNRPGGYENAEAAAKQTVRTYAENYGEDFSHRREVEAHFEIPVEKAVISGSIDLLLREDENGEVLEANVVDFKAMEGGETPELSEDLEWTELALQVQLYAKAANEVLGEGAKTGAVHLLKDNQRVQVPVDDAAIDSAMKNVEWAVGRILEGDFPMRPQPDKCEACDFQKLCHKRREEFSVEGEPPEIRLPAGESRRARAFTELG